MPTDRNGSGRGVEIVRGVSTREPIRRESLGGFSSAPYSPPASGVPSFQSFPYRGGAGGSPFIGGGGTYGPGGHIDFPINPEIDGTGGSDEPKPLYGTDSPFAILADLFARGGGATTDEGATGNQFYPVGGGSSGGGNIGIIFIILLALGAGYYFFIYKKKGAE